MPHVVSSRLGLPLDINRDLSPTFVSTSSGMALAEEEGAFRWISGVKRPTGYPNSETKDETRL